MTARRSILRGVALQTGGNLVASTLSAVKGIVFASLLGPAQYGAWGLLTTLQVISNFSDMGVSLVANREIPRAFGNTDTEGMLAHVSAANWATLVTSLVFGLVVGLAWPATGWPPLAASAVLVPLLFVTFNTFGLGIQVSRNVFAFDRASAGLTVSAVLSLGLGWAASRAAGLSGLLVSQSAVYGTTAIFLLATVGLGSAFALPRVSVIVASLREGWRLLVPILSGRVFISLDVLVCGATLGPANTGLYAVALLGSTMAAGVVAQSVQAVVGQYVMRESGGTMVAPPERLVWAPAALLAAVLAPVCLIASLLAPVLVPLILPKYAGAVLPLQILLVAAYLLQSQAGFSSTLVAVGRQLLEAPVYLILGAVNVAIDLVLIRAGIGIVAIATGTLVVNTLYAIVNPLLIRHVTRVEGRRHLAQPALVVGAALLPAAPVVWRLFGPLPGAPALAAGLVCWTGLALVARDWVREEAS